MRWDLKRFRVCIFLVLAIILMQIGFSALSQSLTISGKVRAVPWRIDMQAGNWERSNYDIVMVKNAILGDNISVQDLVVQMPDVNSNFTYNFTLHNKGLYDAKISDIIITQPSCRNVKGISNADTERACSRYTIEVLNGDNSTLELNTVIPSFENLPIKMRVSYVRSSDPGDDIEDDVIVSNLGFTIVFVQV